MRNKILYILVYVSGILLACPGFIPNNLWAEIYSYVDKDGVMHFSNAPTSSRYKYIGPELSLRASVYFPKNKLAGVDDIIREASQYHGISYELIKAVVHAESNFNPDAISKSGAIGLMQIMPTNFKSLGISDPFDPRDNVMAGTRYLKQLMKKFNNNLPLSLAAYNAGPGAVEKHNDIPPYPETENYVEKVLKYYSLYKN